MGSFNNYISRKDENTDLIRLYRIENPNIPYDASKEQNGILGKGLTGQWFTNDSNYLFKYIRKNQQQEGIRLVYVDIPKSDLEMYHVSNHPHASQMDVEPNNWIIPLTIKRQYIDLSAFPKISGNIQTWAKGKEELNNIIRIQ